MAQQRILEISLEQTGLKRLFRVGKQTWLLWILAMAVVLRLGSALALGNQVQVLPGIHDQLSYDALARRLVDGYGFSFEHSSWPLTRGEAPTAHWSFLYSLYLAGVYALIGVRPLAARLVQAAVVGVLMPWLVYRIGRRVYAGAESSQRIGLLAAGWVAAYGYLLYYAGALMTESFYITAILWALDCTLRLWDELQAGRSGKWCWLELGLALGITALLRQLFLLFTPFLFLWLWWAAGQKVGWLPAFKRLLVGGLACGAVMAALILPFTLRNYRAFQRFVLLNTNAGYAFFWANHPIYGDRFIPILPAEMGSYQVLIPQELRGLDEAALESALMERAMGFILDDPGRYVRLSLSRIPAYFMFWPAAESSLPSNLTRVLSFGLALPFMLAGIGLWALDVRKGSLDAAPGLLLLLFAGVYTGVHLLSWALIRYRLPVDAVGLVFAAGALWQVVEFIARKVN